MCDDEDGPEAYQEFVRRARKAHRCYACRETIPRGDYYQYSSGIWDGEPGSYRHCLRCAQMLAALTELSKASVRLDLNCGVSFEAAFDRPPPPELAALAFATREEMQAEMLRERAKRS